jgi:cytochrome c oxidase assembly factor CtaG
VHFLIARENWPLEPVLGVVVLIGALYGLGLRRRAAVRRRSEWRWRAASFYLGLLAVAAALDSPIAAYDDRYLSVHMTQHLLLMTVAAPLIVLGRPFALIWQPLPLAARRAVAGSVANDRWAAPLRSAGRFLARPLVALLLANVVMVLWHLPRLYDATVTNGSIHELEHTLFFSTSLLLWMQLVDSPPFHARLDRLRRAVYALITLTVSWLLAIVLAFSPSPLYAAYAEPWAAGRLTGLADQQLAAGVLWVPGSIALTIAVCVNFYLWLDPSGGRRTHALAGQH